MQGFGRKYTKNPYFYGNPICQRSNRLSRGGIGAEIISKKDTKRYDDTTPMLAATTILYKERACAYAHKKA